jgi:excinuclease ABC subunit A
MSEKKHITIKGARINNLKNIDVKIPRNALIVITGLSGSGKSSLAFDTLYAEGQRRYVESLSSYARQFLGRMSKPETDYIKGIPPAIAIEQKVNTRNPRSTVGTSTEIYEYIKLLYTRIGKTYSPISGSLVKKHQAKDVIEYITSLAEDTKFAILAPIKENTERTFVQQIDILQKQGFTRLDCNNEFIKIQDVLDNKFISSENKKNISLVIDRLSVKKDDDFISRTTDSVETAFYEGKDECIIKVFSNEDTPAVKHFSKKFEADGMTFEVSERTYI